MVDAEVEVVEPPPEVRLAQRLAERRALEPPIDVEALVRDYAMLEDVDFPVEIDGLCLDLKVVGKKPRVFIDRRSPLARRRFTLAHELGHILIPWHVGSIIDQIDETGSIDDSYQEIEAEANRFASELLMPSSWVRSKLSASENPLDALKSIVAVCRVSRQAAAIKFADCLPPNHVIAQSKEGRVDWSARSAGTLAPVVPWGFNLLTENPFPYPCDRWTCAVGDTCYALWRFKPLDLAFDDVSAKDWRNLLNEIVDDIVSSNDEQKKFKSSINGVTSYANGQTRSDPIPAAIATSMIQRLHASAAADDRYAKLVAHPRFNDYCRARALDYAARRRS